MGASLNEAVTLQDALKVVENNLNASRKHGLEEVVLLVFMFGFYTQPEEPRGQT